MSCGELPRKAVDRAARAARVVDLAGRVVDRAGRAMDRARAGQAVDWAARAKWVMSKALSLDLFLSLSPSLAVGLSPMKIGSFKRRGNIHWQKQGFFLRLSPCLVRLRYLFSNSHLESDHPIF
jgi:hypothetical protein